jgi:hypothetical protein
VLLHDCVKFSFGSFDVALADLAGVGESKPFDVEERTALGEPTPFFRSYSDILNERALGFTPG